MGTKTRWRNGKLQFRKAPMFSAVEANTTNVVMAGAGADIVTTEKTLVEGPIYGGTLSAEGIMHFKAVCGGILSSSEGAVTFNLNWGSTVVTALSLSTAAPKEAYKPFHVEFDGRISGVHTSSGQIAAVGNAWAGFTTTLTACRASTGSTGADANNKMASSNLALTVDSTVGLSISADFASTGGGGAGTTNLLYATYGYIHWYS